MTSTSRNGQPGRPWVVAKFGGTSVASVERWQAIARIAASHQAAGRNVLVVVSALSGVTDRLQRLAGGERGGARDELVACHRKLQEALGVAGCPRVEGWLQQLDALLDDPRAATANVAWQAELLALGELLSSSLGAAWLATQGSGCQWLDARECLLSEPLANQNDWSHYLAATVPERSDPDLSERLAAAGAFHLTQGFIARNPQGATVLLGRGGSDTSAACFGALLGADVVEIWTDVPGMFTANPRQVPDARLLSRLGYEEAQEIVATGARVLHPRALGPLRRSGVPLAIRDTTRPDLPGTRIEAQGPDSAPCIKAVSARKNVTLVSMETVGMWQQVGFLADVFAVFRHHGLSVDMIGSAETNVTVSLDASGSLVNSDVLAALAEDLARVCRVKVMAPCAAITLVGHGMRSLLHRLSAVLAEFGALDVHMISQSSNNLNLTFVVDEALADDLVPRLHDLLIQAGVLRAEDASVYGPSWRELAGAGGAPKPDPWWQHRRAELLDIAAAESPRYVYELATVRRQARALQALGQAEGGAPPVQRWFYAIKANPHPEILHLLEREGFSFECVSPGEIAAVRAALPDLEPTRILFTPSFAPRGEYAAALEQGVAVTLDALHPLQHWGELFRGRDIQLRVDPGFGRGHHDKVRTGGEASKFGLPLDHLPEFRRLAREHQVHITGLHAHSGSGIHDPGHWRAVATQLASLAEDFRRVESLNLGGGLGVPARPDEAPLDLAAVGAALAEVRAAYPRFQLWMEPGRFLVAEAGVLLARVAQVKRKGRTVYVGVDAGMNSLLRPMLYDAWHQIVNLSRLDEPASELVQVVGPICESGDVLGANRRLPPCHEGDVLLVATAGAYGAVMASHYNSRPPAAELVLP